MKNMITTVAVLCTAFVFIGCAENAPQPSQAQAQAPGNVQKVAGSAVNPADADLAMSIEGIHCTGCVKGLTIAFNEIDGIDECAIDFDTNKGYFKLADAADANTVWSKITDSINDMNAKGQSYTIARLDAPTQADSESATPETPKTY